MKQQIPVFNLQPFVTEIYTDGVMPAGTVVFWLYSLNVQKFCDTLVGPNKDVAKFYVL